MAAHPVVLEIGSSSYLSYGLGAANLKDRYRRLALISHPRHLEGLDREDDETLLVVHGWLLWQQTAESGWHSVPYEGAIDAGLSDSTASDIFIRTHDWLYESGADLTVFRGVSLGRLFARELSLLVMERSRLIRAIESLIERFQPDTIVYLDFRAEHSVMDSQGRLDTVRQSAERCGLVVEDKSDPLNGADPHLPFAEFYGRHEVSPSKSLFGWRDMVLGVLVPLSSLIGQILRWAYGNRPSVLLANTHLSALPLIQEFDQPGFAALIFADWYPNKRNLRFLFGNLMKGIYPATAGRPRLNSHDKSAIANIIEHLDQQLANPATGEIDAVRRYAAKYILASEKFEEMARDVLWMERVLERHKPQCIFSDGLDFYLCHILFSLGKARGARNAVTWHGQYVQNVKMWVLGCDPRIDAPIDYFLTWGKINERWLDVIGARVKALRCGNSITQRSTHDIAQRPKAAKRVLLLQYVATGEDEVFPQGKQYNVFVDTVRMLQEIGLSKICLKVHPGPYSVRYYDDVARHFDLDVRVVGDAPFKDLVAWADIVIGPVVSGAMLEVLGAGKPYYPMLIAPHSVDERYLAGLPVFHSVEELKAVLTQENAPHFSSLQNDFSSTTDIPNPAKHTWSVLSELIGPSSDETPQTSSPNPLS